MGFTAIAIPSELDLTYTGSLAQDSFPLLSMLACGPLLLHYWRSRRYLDLGLFVSGFNVAWRYHWCHMDPGGLKSSSALGISGQVWRTVDIVYAQWLLGRTFGHLVGAQHLITLGAANALYMPCILGCFTIAERPTLGCLAAWLLVVLLVTLACKLLLEGPSTFPRGLYSWTGLRCLGAFLIAFIAFPLPAAHPAGYWLWHSIWHIGCAVAFLELYRCLDSPKQTKERKAALNAGTHAKPRGRAVNISVKADGKAE